MNKTNLSQAQDGCNNTLAGGTAQNTPPFRDDDSRRHPDIIRQLDAPFFKNNPDRMYRISTASIRDLLYVDHFPDDRTLWICVRIACRPKDENGPAPEVVFFLPRASASKLNSYNDEQLTQLWCWHLHRGGNYYKRQDCWSGSTPRPGGPLRDDGSAYLTNQDFFRKNSRRWMRVVTPSVEDLLRHGFLAGTPEGCVLVCLVFGMEGIESHSGIEMVIPVVEECVPAFNSMGDGELKGVLWSYPNRDAGKRWHGGGNFGRECYCP